MLCLYVWPCIDHWMHIDQCQHDKLALQKKDPQVWTMMSFEDLYYENLYLSTSFEATLLTDLCLCMTLVCARHSEYL